MYNSVTVIYMIIDLIRLKNDIEQSINVDLMYSFNEEYLSQTDLISLDNVEIKGKITKNSLDDIQIHLTMKGVMVLPCSITLKPVDYPFNIENEQSLDEILNESGENLKKDENTLDILPIIWENILMEIPMKVVSKDASTSNLKGDGWEFVTGERKSTNPGLEKLKDLL